MLGLVVAHLVMAAVLPAVSARNRRAAFGVAAVLPAVTLAWALGNAGQALGPGLDSTTSWAPELGLAFDFRLDALGLVMVVLVSGLGALILAYSAWYFGRRSRDATRTAALLLFFAGVMLGLVLADDLLTLYVFWELTSIASFLLVGQSGEHRANRRAALQALLVTVFGGLAMLLGIVLLGTAAGTYRISEIVTDPPTGSAVTAALVLILLGALTKSAQLPFHPWLPAAMAAPTPVSAYLHAASMVKAGVFLVARLSPAFAERAVWWVPIVALGLGTMLVGGWRALHETDLKRLLAFGTVSQLGFLMVLFGTGGRIAAMAGLALLLGHGLFKAPLFLVVGIVDKVTGTRDVGKLSGLGRRLPSLVVASVLAAASMAGLPLLLGFLGKEAAFEAFLHDGGVRNWLVALTLLAGSTFTVAYSARFLWGAFATKPGLPATEADQPSRGLTVPVWITALSGLVLGTLAPIVDGLARRYGAAYPAQDAVERDYHLALWHGLNLPMLFSAAAVGLGVLAHLRRDALTALHRRLSHPVSAQRGYELVVAGLERFAVRVTGRLQVGSLPAYLGFILLTVLALPGGALLAGGSWPADQAAFHTAIQLPLGLIVVIAALALVRVHRRFTAVLLVGAIGYGIGGLFIVDGAPDLALAQFLVETLTLVAFVFVLRRLPAHFTEKRPPRRVIVPKAVLATTAGILFAVLGVVASGARTAPATASEEFARLAPEAGATNVVNAILVDFRALDTLGEITVLLIAVAGTVSLVLATRHDRRRGTQVTSGSGTPEHEEELLG
ncbi:putative cation antiporter NADH dehydrogenase subunit [Pseudonocardia asaccharolytica DSM 44247 = NBRC 16224]|uniref:Putative cation antiporter NADH dehydrogenase subunit n=1 Tax=Pseudonocardia asaccharolytica DSM 44247 = NBRC 16224 TaxID=1123024 RepID=A0A511D3B5_9PSEU|nr:putative cation antiporter NADH dehydrogenase subunit [Pseudonocardia asaccharolytica DSM 44247 = NBRC 16224]